MTWLQENGALLAAFLSAVATLLAALATYRAPMLAAQVAERMRGDSEKENERRRLRNIVFFTLMQERATIASSQSVQMLNAIDPVFHDCKEVREAWADLYHAFGKPDDQRTGLVEEKQRELLRQMAIHLGLSDSLRRDDFSRTYFPTALAEEHYVQTLRRLDEKRRLEASNATANTAPAFVGPPSPFPPKPQ
jgi:hypothetical protein